MTRYFDLSDDMADPGRWELGEPLDGRGVKVQPSAFNDGQRVNLPGPIRVPIYHPGKALDFSSFATMAVPIVHSQVARLLSEMCSDEVQLLPTRIQGQDDPYYIVNTLRIIKCIDEQASEEVNFWKPEHGRPEKIGMYRGVHGLRIERNQVTGAHIFRPWGWTVVLIVSEALKTAMEALGITGAQFIEV